MAEQSQLSDSPIKIWMGASVKDRSWIYKTWDKKPNEQQICVFVIAFYRFPSKKVTPPQAPACYTSPFRINIRVTRKFL